MKKYVYSEAKQVVVCGDFTRCARTILWSREVDPREHLLDLSICITVSIELSNDMNPESYTKNIRSSYEYSI